MKVLKMKFGKGGEKVDAYGVRFLGDFDSDTGHLGSISEMISDPDVSPITKNKRITLWFIFQKVRAYKNAANLLGQLTDTLKKEDYTIIVSSLDELVDTTLPEYQGKPEGRFPVSDRIHGYNAAGGFSVTAEKTDANSKFSIEEIEAVEELAQKFGFIVYGRPLSKA